MGKEESVTVLNQSQAVNASTKKFLLATKTRPVCEPPGRRENSRDPIDKPLNTKHELRVGTYSSKKEKGVDTLGDSTGSLRRNENGRVRCTVLKGLSVDRSNYT